MTIHGVSVAVCSPDGAKLAADRDATDLIGELWGQDVDMIVIPTTRFADDFFVLSTRVAGEIIQKFVTYSLRLVILGDVTAHAERSSALASYIYESNRGRHVWFLPTLDDLTARLAA
jgi:hypothetical protein